MSAAPTEPADAGTGIEVETTESPDGPTGRIESVKEGLGETKRDLEVWYDFGKRLGSSLAEDDRAQMGGRMFSLVFGAVALGLTIIVLQLMILIGGEFSAAIDGGGPFAEAANSTETNGNTAFEIMSVSTLVIPVVVVVGLLIGAFLTSGGMGAVRQRMR